MEGRVRTAKKRKADADEYALTWTAHAQFHATIVRGGRRLMISVSPGVAGWGVLAIEAASDAASNEDVLKAHGHKMIGVYADPSDAMKAASSWARTWFLGHQAGTIGDCACDELAAPNTKG
jgi:hypothetical protein